MRRGNSRQARAVARQQKHLEQADWSWKIWKVCDVCGNDFCVNCLWEDRKPRTPKYKGVIVCANCDPRMADPTQNYPYMLDRIRPTARGKALYRLVMCLVIVRQLAKTPCLKDEEESCYCLSCASRKLLQRTTP